jgi:hypothetical protein
MVAVGLVLVLAAAVGISAGAEVSEGAKKKKSKPKVFSQQLAANAAIPDAAPPAASVPVRSTITVGKKFKGLKVADVNVTGIQTTGNAATAANDLIARLTAPNGRTLILFRNKGSVSLGPWTLDDDTSVSICDSAPPPPQMCIDPQQQLHRPFAGTSNLVNNDTPSWIPLASFNGLSMRGTWTFTIVDVSPADTSVLNSWGLRITPQKAGAK